MATRTQTAYGPCPTHGQVSATREVPKLTFPFVVYAVKMFAARKEPYRCPECGKPVSVK